MKAKKMGNKLFVRIDKGEEIVGSVKSACEEYGVKAGSVSGIGATDKAVIGIYNPVNKAYLPMERNGDHEITSLSGNVTEVNGEVHLHLHINLTDDTFNTVGGHLNSAIVSVTCEVIVDSADGVMKRAFNEELGVNLWDVRD
jgi:uncharacterized protein